MTNDAPTPDAPRPPAPRRRIARVAVVAAALIAAAAGAAWWWSGREMERARGAIARREWRPARDRLAGLARWSPRDRDEVAYLLGVAASAVGREAEALEALRRVPDGSPFEARAAAAEAEVLVMQWRLAEAEARLARTIRPGRSGLAAVRETLVRLVRMGARFDEARAILRDAFDESADPVGLLRQLWRLDRGVAPTGALRANLDGANAHKADDPRVALGLARIDLLDGRLDSAGDRLRRLDAPPNDPAVARARLDWAEAAGRADDADALLDGPLRAILTPAERLARRARAARLRGDDDAERRALERAEADEPRNPAVLERLAALAAGAGDAPRAAVYRRRKADVDAALDRYRRRITAPDRFEAAADRLVMARLADDAGRPFDARAWATLAARADPKTPGLTDLLARLERPRPAPDAPTPGPARSPSPATLNPAPAARVAFEDDAARAGLDFAYQSGETAIRQLPAAMGGGVALIDFDGDGRLDVFALGGGDFPPDRAHPARGDRLFRNRGDGTFEDATARSGIAALPGGYGQGVAVGDIDNDGHPDLFLTRWRSYALYRNRGDGTFEDRTAPAGLGGDRDWPTSAAFADLDNDGDLDLYVCHYLAWDAANPETCRDAQTQAYATCSPRRFAALPDHVFRNDGGQFVDVSKAAGVDDADGRGLGVLASDLDGDGRVDLFVANDQSANFLYRNLGGFRFEETGHASGVASSADGGYKAGMGVASADLDGDGRPELAVTNFYGESTTLYQNLGGGVFADRTAPSGLALATRTLLGFGVAFLDADDDGRPDLLTANGHLDHLPGTPYGMPTQLLLAVGGRFRDATADAGPALTRPRVGRALAVGDLDNDGRVDALVVDHDGPLASLRNVTTGGGHRITFALEGTRSNRDAVGTTVALNAGGHRQTAARQGGGSYAAASDPRLHFGLGPAAVVDSVEVRWPSGLIQTFRSLAADRAYRLREGDATPSPLAGFARH